MEEKKPTLLEKATKGRHWAMVQLIKDLAPAERVAPIQELLLAAAKGYDDEQAGIFFDYLMAALEEKDSQENPLPSEKEWQAREKAKREGEWRVALARAALAKELYEQLPNFRPATGRAFVAQDETVSVDIKVSTLSKTKRAMLGQVARGWTLVGQEEELKYFEFLMQAERAAGSFKEEKETVEEVLRSTAASLEVLIRTLRAYPGRETLVHAWARRYSGFNVPSPGTIVGAVGNLCAASTDVVPFLQAIADGLSDLDRKIRDIKGLPGQSSVVYHSLTAVTIEFRVKGTANYEKYLHRDFEAARNAISEAKKDWKPFVSIELRGRLVYEYDEKQVLATREDRL